ncbi:MAG: hypothetical protein K0S74_1333 [Chlamydiales bacterium]|jgi:hypothetical protein|nr:hypothetical protein [Chlamydiales bacterium]
MINKLNRSNIPSYNVTEIKEDIFEKQVLCLLSGRRIAERINDCFQYKCDFIVAVSDEAQNNRNYSLYDTKHAISLISANKGKFVSPATNQVVKIYFYILKKLENDFAYFAKYPQDKRDPLLELSLLARTEPTLGTEYALPSLMVYYYLHNQPDTYRSWHQQGKAILEQLKGPIKAPATLTYRVNKMVESFKAQQTQTFGSYAELCREIGLELHEKAVQLEKYDNIKLELIFETSMKLIEEAANYGNIQAQLHLGLACLEQREYDHAKIWLKKAAEKGNSSAIDKLREINPEGGFFHTYLEGISNMIYNLSSSVTSYFVVNTTKTPKRITMK